MARVPKIFFAGDVHGQFTHLLRLVYRERPDAVILLGDLEPSRPLEVELKPILDKTIIRFIHGNHDTDSQETYHNVFRSAIGHWNLHGRVEEVCGVRIGGLGGVFREKIWMPPAKPTYQSYQCYFQSLDDKRPPRERNPGRLISTGQERQHCSSIFPDIVSTLESQNADVLVTHEAPSCHRYGFHLVDELARSMGVKALFHGHHHDDCVYQMHWQCLGFRAYGVGLRRVTQLGLQDLEPLTTESAKKQSCAVSLAANINASSGDGHETSCRY